MSNADIPSFSALNGNIDWASISANKTSFSLQNLLMRQSHAVGESQGHKGVFLCGRGSLKFIINAFKPTTISI